MLKIISSISGALAFAVAGYWACTAAAPKQAPARVYSAVLTELSDAEYPDNPDLEAHHPDCPKNAMLDIRFWATADSLIEV